MITKCSFQSHLFLIQECWKCVFDIFFFAKGSLTDSIVGVSWSISFDHLYAHIHKLSLTSTPILTSAVGQQNNHQKFSEIEVSVSRSGLFLFIFFKTALLNRELKYHSQSITNDPKISSNWIQSLAKNTPNSGRLIVSFFP